MGLFSKKSKLTREEINQALLSVNTLDKGERDALRKRFLEERDFGGVSCEEWRDVIRELRRDNVISEIDYRNLKKLVK